MYIIKCPNCGWKMRKVRPAQTVKNDQVIQLDDPEKVKVRQCTNPNCGATLSID